MAAENRFAVYPSHHTTHAEATRRPGSARLKTAISQDGVHTLGTYGNCAGGVTPWGTVLTGEENIDMMFAGDQSQSSEAASLKRFGMQVKAQKSWAKYYPRWDLSVQHPGEDSTYEKPSTRWPDFDDKLPPRPAVVVISRQDGQPIGS